MDIAKLKKVSAEATRAVWVTEEVHLLVGVELLMEPTVSKESQRDFNRTLRHMSREQGGEEITDDIIASTEDRLMVRSQLRDWKGLRCPPLNNWLVAAKSVHEVIGKFKVRPDLTMV